ncbi:hypothetical protein CPT32_29635 [Rhizobium sophoriradicis]|nr:hypothetical protein CPT32_29635 [Rhizobium sophoriradicis]PDS72468.1 hypothetical protein CO667_33200 [Rhizobium sp. L43]
MQFVFEPFKARHQPILLTAFDPFKSFTGRGLSQSKQLSVTSDQNPRPTPMDQMRKLRTDQAAKEKLDDFHLYP